MFGLKIIKEDDYSALKYQLQSAQDLLIEKECTIKSLKTRIQELEDEVNDFMKKGLENLERNSKPETVLLTDIAETPLKEEKKTARKTKRVVKKVDGTSRKKIVRKTEEV